jgi:hypothetical protein
MSPTRSESASNPSSGDGRAAFDVGEFLTWFFVFIFCCAAFSFYSYVIAKDYRVDYGEGEVFEEGFEPE